MTVTKTIASTTASSTLRVASQDGIIGGSDPSVYDPKNPIIIFIIQVTPLNTPNHIQTDITPGRHNPPLLPPPPLPPRPPAPTPRHRRSHRRRPPRPLRHGPHPRFHSDHLSFGRHAESNPRRQPGSRAVPFPRRAGSRPALSRQQLARGAQCGLCGDGAAIWIGVCDCVGAVSSVWG